MKRLVFGAPLMAAALACAGDPPDPPVQAPAAVQKSTRGCTQGMRRPVLFVHGSGHGGHSWNVMRRHLASIGYREDWLDAVELEPNDGANVRAAERFIAPAAERLLSHAGREATRIGCPPPDKLDIVAHSMGAVSSRWFATRMAPARVHTWIGIGASNHGTNKLCGAGGAGNAEMCPAFAPHRGASAVQFELNGARDAPRDETPYGLGRDANPAVTVAPTSERAIRYYTIRIEPDEWIEPVESALLDGAGGGSRAKPALPAAMRETTPGNLLFDAKVPHDWLPTNDVVAATVAALLGPPS